MNTRDAVKQWMCFYNKTFSSMVVSPFDKWAINGVRVCRRKINSFMLYLNTTTIRSKSECALIIALLINAAVNVNYVPPWSEVDANWRRILRSKIFFHRQFSGEPTQIMRRKFVEYLGTDCFHFCRIPVELSVVSASNTKRTKRSTKCTDNIT
jgi:hypothetical protein